jgi:hypothetical protein
LVLALGSAFTLAAAIGAVSCKQNVINSTTNNGTEVFESQVSQMVGPSGFDVIGPDKSEAQIPAGALSQTVTITIGKLKSGYPDFPSGWALPTDGGVYAFEPHDTVFSGTTPVTLKVPYPVGTTAPIRLVTAEPNGTWSTVDHIPVAGGLATTPTTHFSYYALITGDGAEPPPLLDAGADAETDATMDDAAPMEAAPPVEAGPPPNPTLFAVSATNGTAYRFEITPSTVVPSDGGAGDAGDAGDAGGGGQPTVVYGQFNDGGVYPVTGGYVPETLAMGSTGGVAPYTLFIGGAVPGDAGAGAVLSITDPFGSPAFGGSFAVPDPSLMAFHQGDLWVATGNPPEVVVFTGGVQTWPSGVVISSAGYGGMAIDPTHGFLYLSDNSGVDRWQFTGINSGTNAIEQMPPLTSHLTYPQALVVAPWGQLLVADGETNSIVSFDLSQSPPAWVSTIDFNAIGGPSTIMSFTVVQWPSGLSELFVGDYMAGLFRLALDASHSPIGTPQLAGAGLILNQIVAAP